MQLTTKCTPTHINVTQSRPLIEVNIQNIPTKCLFIWASWFFSH